MKYTSAEASKLLRALNDKYTSVVTMECQSREFNAALGEDPESVRPEYSYEDTAKELSEIAEKIRKVKHAISRFNLETEVPELGMTVDMLLVYIPQLTSKKTKLQYMAQKLPKVRERVAGIGSNTVIDYNYVNYDLEKVRADYEAVSALLSKAQTALDKINSTKTMEIDVEL